MNKKATKNKKQRLIKGSLIVVVIGLISFTIWYVISASNKSINSLDKASSSRFIPSKKRDSDSQSSSSKTPSSKSDNIPFSISKVYFAQVPKKISTDTGPEQTQCKPGDTISYQAIAQVTSTNKGTVQYHWETADHLGGTIQKLDSQSYGFSAAGTNNIAGNFTYLVRETNGPGYYWDRIYLNLVVTSPNNTYANKENPTYAYKDNQPFFIWGSYIDLC